MVCVAACITIEAGTVVHARVAVGGAGSVPQRCELVENRLMGELPEGSVLDEAVRLSAEAECIDGIHATVEYRRHLLAVLTRRAVAQAAQRAASAS